MLRQNDKINILKNFSKFYKAFESKFIFDIKNNKFSTLSKKNNMNTKNHLPYFRSNINNHLLYFRSNNNRIFHTLQKITEVKTSEIKTGETKINELSLINDFMYKPFSLRDQFQNKGNKIVNIPSFSKSYVTSSRSIISIIKPCNNVTRINLDSDEGISSVIGPDIFNKHGVILSVREYDSSIFALIQTYNKFYNNTYVLQYDDETNLIGMWEIEFNNSSYISSVNNAFAVTKNHYYLLLDEKLCMVDRQNLKMTSHSFDIKLDELYPLDEKLFLSNLKSIGFNEFATTILSFDINKKEIINKHSFASNDQVKSIEIDNTTNTLYVDIVHDKNLIKPNRSIFKFDTNLNIVSKIKINGKHQNLNWKFIPLNNNLFCLPTDFSYTDISKTLASSGVYELQK